MSTPRRFLNGVSSVNASHPLAQFPYLDPTTWSIWMEDFLHYDIAQGDAAWILDQVNAGEDGLLGQQEFLHLP